MIKVGFTGTRHGMSEQQKKEFAKLVNAKDFSEFHHGVCIGSDEQAHNIILQLNKAKDVKIVGHPPKFKGSIAQCDCDVNMKPFDYLERNHHIVDATDILVATPDTKEKIRSGTWSTVRYARGKKKKIYIIKQNGRVVIE